MSLARKFTSDGIAVALPLLLSRGLAVALIPLYTRSLTLSEYGALDLLIVFGSIVNLVAPLEISQALARFYHQSSESERRSLASTAFYFSLSSYSIFVCACLIFQRPMSQWLIGSEDAASELLLGAIFISLNGLSILGQVQLRFALRPRLFAVIVLIQSAALLSAVGLIAVYGKLTLLSILGSMAFSYGAGLAGCATIIRTEWHARASLNLLRRMLKFSIPLVPSSAAVFVNMYAGRIGLNIFEGLDEVGVFGLAFRIASITLLFTSIVSATLTPLVYAGVSDPATRHGLAQLFFYFCVASLLLSVATALFADQLVNIFGGANYVAAAQLVPILTAATLLSQLYMFFPGLFIAEKTSWIMGLNFGGAILNAIGCLVLIPRYGALGAAVAAVTASAAVFAAHAITSQKLFPVRHRWKHLSVATVCALAIHILIYCGR